MSETMWFLFGGLCGVGLTVLWRRPKAKRHPDERRSGSRQHDPSKAWVQTHNFLYYDGTEMPQIKEDLNE